MKFIEKFSTFFGSVSAREFGNQVKVTGVDGLVMATLLMRIWHTSKLNKEMFSSITDTSFSFNKFFVPDVCFMFEEMEQDSTVPWSAKRTAAKIVSELKKNTWYKRAFGPVTSIIDESQLKRLKWKPLPKQEEFLHLFGDKMPRYGLSGYLLAMAPGLGKAQPLNATILTNKGWVTMADVTLNTEVICPDGTLANVVGIYPQGMKDIYRITLENGQSAECCDDHLWKVFYDKSDTKGEIISLHHIRNSAKMMYIPIYDPTTNITELKRVVTVRQTRRAEAQCIAVDHPDHLYITDDYIVTHNTFTDFMVATCVIPPSVAEIKIIITPKKAMHLVWEKTVKTVFVKTPTSWCSDSPGKMPLDGVEYYIFNFEALDKALDLARHLLSRGKRYFTIVDESHNFADRNSNRTKKLVQLQTLKPNLYFVWTSGSPVLKSAAELSSFLKCSDPLFDADAERRFVKIYANASGRANQIFNHRLGNQMAFIVGKQEGPNTVKPIIRELPVRLPKQLADQYTMKAVREEMRLFIEERLKFYTGEIKELKRIVNKWMDYHETRLATRPERRKFYDYQKALKIISRAPDMMFPDLMRETRQYERYILLPSLPPTERKNFKHALSAVKNIKLKVRGEALGTVLSKRRSECAAHLGLYCDPEKIMKESLSKTLFFASSVLPVAVLEKYLSKNGHHPLLVYGGTAHQLVTMMEEFDTDPNLNPVCATMQSLSEAVPVTAASTVVLLNRPFRQATFDQVIARADRLGQKHPVTVIEVTLDTGDEPNVSSSTDKILATIRELINDIVGEAFAGPDPDERQYAQLIDASQKDPNLLKQEDAAQL